jgi:prepilin-type N-terminal cleavage/methylation domain-containing protein
MFKRFRNNEKGFTLMEIVIVIVILGILALLAIPRLLGFTEQAEISSDKEYAAVVARAAELYDAAHSKDNPVVATTQALLETADLVEYDATALQFDKYGTGSCSVVVTNGTAVVTISYGTGHSIVYTSSGATKGYALTGL